MHHYEVVILGAGVAGTATAIGLKKLGYHVAVIQRARRFNAIEGLSKRVLNGLHHAGCLHALKTVNDPTPRSVYWNGQHNDANVEHLVERATFDKGLLADLAAYDIPVYTGDISKIQYKVEQSHISYKTEQGVQSLTTGFIVEARGRRAPSQGKALRGINTLAILLHYHNHHAHIGSQLCSFADGWAWYAHLPHMPHAYLQFSISAHHPALQGHTKRAELAEQCLQQLPQEFIDQQELNIEHISARNSTSTLHHEVVSNRMIRVGDAAMAVDPLSGNGVFQALSSALIAPSVIHTQLTMPENTAIAQQFYVERIETLFYRFVRIGRDFYRDEQGYNDNEFWQTRQTYPDNEEAHAAPDPAQVKIAKKAVVNEGVITEEEVVISSDNPLGIWHIEGIRLAPLVRYVQQHNITQPLKCQQALSQHFNFTQAQLRPIYQWLKMQGLL